MPTLNGILETSLYVADLDRSVQFYQSLFAVETMVRDERIAALNIAGRQVLLLFRKGASLAMNTPHDGDGMLHVAFAIPREELTAWEKWLATRNIAIEGRTEWTRGGVSLYFRDPDRHLLELATPGVWANY